MSKTKDILGGGFLTDDLQAEQMVTPEDFTDEHKMIAKTTEDFVVGEVVPKLEKIENHEFDHSLKLMDKAGELGLLSADIPEEYGGIGLDTISSSLITEKFSRAGGRSEEHTSEIQSRGHLVCRLLLEKENTKTL